MSDTGTWQGWLEAFGSEAARRMVVRVNRPLEQGASAVEVQRGADEVLLWILGSLELDRAALEKKGIPSSLRKRLIEAYAEDVSLDPDRWGKLGKAKWHVWTPDNKWNEDLEDTPETEDRAAGGAPERGAVLRRRRGQRHWAP